MSLDSSSGRFDGSRPVKGELRDVTQLAENRKRKYVNQGSAELSKKGEELQSEGFSQCSALIVQGEDEAYLAHIDKWDLSDKQYEVLDELPAGKYTATFVTGSMSRVGSSTLANKDVSGFMEKLESNGRKVEVKDDVEIDSGGGHWWLSYNPKEKKAKILNKKDRTIEEYNLD